MWHWLRDEESMTAWLVRSVKNSRGYQASRDTHTLLVSSYHAMYILRNLLLFVGKCFTFWLIPAEIGDLMTALIAPALAARYCIQNVSQNSNRSLILVLCFAIWRYMIQQLWGLKLKLNFIQIFIAVLRALYSLSMTERPWRKKQIRLKMLSFTSILPR